MPVAVVVPASASPSGSTSRSRDWAARCGLPSLTGSPAQIASAEDIRHRLIEGLNRAVRAGQGVLRAGGAGYARMAPVPYRRPMVDRKPQLQTQHRQTRPLCRNSQGLWHLFRSPQIARKNHRESAPMKAAILLIACLPMLADGATRHGGRTGDWQDAILVSFKTVAIGSSCSTTGNVQAEAYNRDNINATTNADTVCGNTVATLYTLRVGQNVLEVEPTISGGKTAAESALVIGTIGYGALFLRNRVSLKDRLPGTHASIRQHGSKVEISVGKRHSLYTVVTAK